MKKLTILFLLIFSFTQTYSQNWYPLGLGTNGRVNAIAYSNGSIFAGGLFTTAGGVNVNHIAKWNRNSWAPLGSGIDSNNVNAVVHTITSIEGGILVGGGFSSAGGDTAAFDIAIWDGSWHPLSHGLLGEVYATEYRYQGFYAGGYIFGARFGVPAQKIMQWVGGSWDSLAGGNNLDGQINALTKFNGNLIAGGNFLHAGGVSLNYIAQWNGSSWAPLGSGMNGTVFSLTLYNDNLIAGGNFYQAGGVNANHVAKWNGSTWTPLGIGLDYYVEALSVFQGNLIAAPAHGIYCLGKWDGISWSAFGNGGPGGVVFSLLSRWNGLYAGGLFSLVGSTCIAEWIGPGTVYNRRNIWKSIISNQTTIDTNGYFSYDSTGGNYDSNPSLYITDVNVTIDTVTYPRDSDLEFYLTHQSITDTLIYQAGGTGANFTGTILNDSASIPISNGTAPFTGSFRPFKPLSRFNGLDPGGDWILKVYNRGTGNTGTLKAWSLSISYGVNPIGIKPISSEVPKSFKLMQNYPNPFNPSTKINFALPKSAFVKLTIYDVSGREVTALVNDQLKPGSYEAEWNASDYSSGLYFYKLVVGDPNGQANTNNGKGFSETKKMVLIK